MKQHPILYIYLTRPTGAEGAEVPKKGPEVRTNGIKMKQTPIVNIYLHPPQSLYANHLGNLLGILGNHLGGSLHQGVRSKTEENLFVM